MEEEEYVLLDLDDVCAQAHIPPGDPYDLSGLHTLNPALTIGATLKLIGEYQETIGTCYLFSDKGAEKEVVHPAETGSSDVSLFEDKCFVASNEASSKEVQPVAGLHKILKFRIANACETATAK